MAFDRSCAKGGRAMRYLKRRELCVQTPFVSRTARGYVNLLEKAIGDNTIE